MALDAHRFAASLVTTLTVMSAGMSGAQTAASQREALAAALETLITAGPAVHATHDAGEWLQLAVDEAISRGDAAIERLAVRAASPLRARITRPVTPTESLTALEINTHRVLKVPRPVGYSAQILVALDGAGFVQVGEARSEKTETWRVDTLLGRATGVPGVHTLRVRARLTFRDPARGGASWTELRDLPGLSYAVYDVTAQPTAGSLDVRALVYGPASINSRELDPLLPEEPFAVWLGNVLSTRRTKTDPPPDWMAHYCSERTAEAGTLPVTSAVCSVVYFQVRDFIGQIWFRTADVQPTDAGVRWERTAPPQFEGFVIKDSAPESRRLSLLTELLDTDPALRPVGDVAISPEDIVVTPPDPKAGAPFSVAITVRNQGSGDLFKVAVRVALATHPNDKGSSRQFVVDLAAHSSTEIKFEAALPQGYGVLLAHAMQLTEHSPFENWTPDPTPEDGCAFLIVNPRAAPPRHFESIVDASGCRGR
jgi:hypothetical protein